MNGRRRALAIVFALGLGGCSHTQSTDEGRPPPEERTPPSDATPRPRASKPPPRDGSSTPVASSASGLLEPGAEDQIRDRLGAAGFPTAGENGSIAGPLKHFQETHDLPATGVPDHATVKKLGLDPDKVFRKAAGS